MKYSRFELMGDTFALCLMYEINDDVPIMQCHLDTIRTMFLPIKDRTPGPGLILTFTWCGREPTVRGQKFYYF